MNAIMQAFTDAAKKDPEFNELLEGAKAYSKEKVSAERKAKEEADRVNEIKLAKEKAEEKQRKIEANLKKTLWTWTLYLSAYTIISGVAFCDSKEELEMRLEKEYSDHWMYNKKQFRVNAEPLDLAEEITEISSYDG